MRTRVAWKLLVITFTIGACTYTLPNIEDLPPCGDGVESDGETCDDGNLVDGDGCDSNCTITDCRNGIITVGEDCDDGNKNDLDACTNSCTKAKCGDRVVQPGEDCDDGNLDINDACDPNCRNPGCGNGFVGAGEVCHDGNTVSGDNCNTTCTLKGLSTLFVGQPGVNGTLDGIGDLAQLNGAHYMALYGDYIYIANNLTVRLIEINSRAVTTVAGSASEGGYFDGATGAESRFADLRGIATDGTTIWVADVGNHVIRAINPALGYAVTTVAGYQETTPPIDIVDGMLGVARLDSPRGLTYHDGKVYFLEPNKSVLRVFNPGDTMVTTIAGTLSSPGPNDGFGLQAQFNGPRHITVAGPTSLFISDTTGRKIRSYDTMTGEVKTIAGTATCGYGVGNALAANLYSPRGLALDGQNLYFVEDTAHTIRQLRVDTMDLSTLSGTPETCLATCLCTASSGAYAEGSGGAAKWNTPYDMVYHAGTHALYVSDGDNYVIRKIE
jgi:cysteine-rich repeat protein